MAETIDYVQAVKDKKSELSSLHERMDTDRDLVNLAKFVLQDVDKNKIPHAVSVTLNDPAVFAANVESSLGGATEQVVAETDDENIDTAYIEDFVRAALGSANRRLIMQGRYSLNPYFDQQMCRRGGGAARCWFHMEGDTLITDVVPWDRRFVYYELGTNGLAWAAYETTRSKGKILADYPDAKVDGKEGTVLDIYTPEHNEVHVDGKRARDDVPHPFGFTPVCVQTVPLGSMLADKDNIQYEGESLFFLIRDLIPEMNRLASIIQTLNLKAIDDALQWESDAGVNAEVPDHDEITAPNAVTAVDKGGGAKPVPYGELRRSAWLLHSIIETRIQKGSLSNFDMGTFTQPMSAVALVEIGEGRDQVFLPRLGARGLLNQQLALMAIEQCTVLDLSNIELGPRGHKRTFQLSKLQGEYDITFKYFIKSPKIDIARYSIAAAAGNTVSDRTKRREIIQLEDPEEEERWLRWEEAERLSPAIKMSRTIRGLQEMAERGDKDAEFEAEILEDEMETYLQNIGMEQAPEPEKRQEPQPLLPLMGQGGSGKKKPLEMEEEPE